MIFPDKPRPPWQYAQPRTSSPRAVVEVQIEDKPTKQPRPPGYWRERIEFAIIVVGFYFWVDFWIHVQ